MFFRKAESTICGPLVEYEDSDLDCAVYKTTAM